MYDVLNILSIFVFGYKADPKNGEHMINYDANDECIKISDQQEAIKKMQQVNCT